MRNSLPMTAPASRLLRTACRLSVCAVVFTIVCGQIASADELELRRQQIANLSLSEQQQLLRNQQRFERLSAAEQERLRTLHADLQADPNQARLQQVLDRYYDWLKTLSPEQRAELEDLDYAARVKRIQELMARQREDHSRRRPRFGGEPLPKEDQRALYAWFRDLAWQRRDEILASMSESRRQQVERQDEPAQRKSLALVALQRVRSDQFLIEAADYERLLKELSPDTRDKLARAPSPQQKKRLTRQWLGHAMFSRMSSHSMRRVMASISDEELKRFLDELPKSERQRLLSLPPGQQQEELKRLYVQRESGPEGPPPFGRPPHDEPEHRRRGWDRRPEGAEYPPRGPRDRPRGEGHDPIPPTRRAPPKAEATQNGPHPTP